MTGGSCTKMHGECIENSKGTPRSWWCEFHSQRNWRWDFKVVVSFPCCFMLFLYIKFLTSIRSKRPKIFRYSIQKDARGLTCKQQARWSRLFFSSSPWFLSSPNCLFQWCFGMDWKWFCRGKRSQDQSCQPWTAYWSSFPELRGLRSKICNKAWNLRALTEVEGSCLVRGAGKCQPVTLDVPEAEVFCRSGGPIHSPVMCRWLHCLHLQLEMPK